MEFLLTVIVVGIIIVVIYIYKDITPIDNKLKPINKGYNTKLNSNKTSIYIPDDKLIAFARTQLIGGLRFIESYDVELKKLHSNTAFMNEISQLRIKYYGHEIINTRYVNKDIADYFYYNKLNEKYVEVENITQKVKKYGKQASAHISIYYAMFLYD